MSTLQPAAADRDVTAVEGPAGGTAPLAFDGTPATIMLVDDEPIITEVLRLYLEDAGYRRFVDTNDALTAVELARGEQPDLLLLDLMMPGCTGFQVLEALRGSGDTRHLPVIVLTSATDPQSKMRALELGASDFLAKPVDPSELALRVRNILTVKSYQDRLAFCDHVTGLPNRRRFLDVLERTLGTQSGAPSACAVLQLGMDRFKQINDALGYGAGDGVLRALGERIREALADRACTVARTGGDEFTVMLPDVGCPQSALDLADELRRRVSEPMTCFGEALVAPASVGVALSPAHGVTMDDLLAHAGQALSFAKRRGGSECVLYSDEIDSWARDRLQLERDLRGAVAAGRLRLAFQPKIDVTTERVVGAEALLRWFDPVRGEVAPADFVPLAEATGLIVPIGAWVLRESCRVAGNWHRLGLDTLGIAVNVSVRQFQEPGLCRQVQEALHDGGLPARFLTLEVTESMLMEDPETAARTLEGLKALGVRLSVDDFGTGYSSLAYLKRFSMDELKIDRSFVQEVPENADDEAIVTAIMAMARSLGLEVVAEGVERGAQLAFLAGAGCDRYQGFLFSPAVPDDDFLALATAPASRLLELCATA